MPIDSFSHVALKVDDVAESATFYQQQFGASVIESKSDTAVEDGGTRRMALAFGDKRLDLFDRAPYEVTGAVDDVPNGFLHIGCTVEDLERMCFDLAASGVNFLMQPLAAGDLQLAYLETPSGLRIELAEDTRSAG